MGSRPTKMEHQVDALSRTKLKGIIGPMKSIQKMSLAPCRSDDPEARKGLSPDQLAIIPDLIED
jgi:hypothetical protein